MKATAKWVVIVASAVVAFGLRGGGFGESVELPPAEDETKAAEAVAAEVEQEKALKEQERKIEAEKHFNTSAQALREGKYDEAIEELTAAVAADPENENYKETLKRTRIMQITIMLSEEKFAEARDLCDQFLSDYPGNEPVARFREQAIAELEKPPAPAEEEKLVVPAEELPPTAEQLLAEAKDLIRKKDYEMAKDKLLDARELSPYDIDIYKKIKQLQEQLTRWEQAHARARREEMLTEIFATWAKRTRRAVTVAGPEVGPVVAEPSEHKEEILRKLDEIIPEVKFEDANLTEVLDFLSREVDVNIVIDPVVFQGGYSQPTTGIGLTPGAPGGFTPTPGGPTMTPGAFPGPGGTTFPPGLTTPGMTTPGMTSPMGTPGISETTAAGAWIPPIEESGIKLNLKNVPLKEVLKYVLKWKNLKYVVEDYAILIAPVDYVPPESLETEIFRLATTGIGIIDRPDLAITGDSLLQGPTDASGSTAFDTGLPGAEGGPGATETIREFLAQSGVPWPMGSNIIYNRRTGTVIVTNTPTNMVLIRELVNLWDQPSLQVEIESRFVEILYTRYFENSFEMGMLSPLVFTKKATRGPSPAGARKRFEVDVHPERGTRFFPELLPMAFPTPDADQIFSISGIMTEPDFQFVWHAINQRDWSDLLSAPRITTVSGQQAQIEVVQELTYPTEYDTETINIGGGLGGTTNLVSGEVFMVTPGNWEKRDVGIILNVTPTVSADGRMITLVLMPEVTDLVKWINYGNEIYPINQPIFETRNVTTTVHVEDGETIVLGGLITDKTTTYEDKIPLLGSIPFIGRFFRSHAETTSKANLIIFVTARLITSKGIGLAAQRESDREQARVLQKRIRESKEEAGEIAPGLVTSGIME
ncbi:hypothetical protein HQ563_00650 [bacterium]|nr:hypothetical protein [bacterium]